MREIRFRAWIKNDRRMIEWFPQFFADTSPVTSYGDDFPENDDNVVLMQYTGIKDKNGVEIYEGDIVSLDRQAEDDPARGFYADNYEVRFNNGCWGMYSEELAITEYLTYWNRELEVIGNIYEHPDLLK